VAWLEDDARVDPLRDDTPCRWPAPKLLERPRAARDGRTVREWARAMSVALIPGAGLPRVQDVRFLMTGVLRRGMLVGMSRAAAVDRWSVVLMVALVLLSPVLYELGSGFAR
jgi:hypothetical protein